MKSGIFIQVFINHIELTLSWGFQTFSTTFCMFRCVDTILPQVSLRLSLVYQFLFKWDSVRHQVDFDGKLNKSINWKRFSLYLVFSLHGIIHSIAVFIFIWKITDIQVELIDLWPIPKPIRSRSISLSAINDGDARNSNQIDDSAKNGFEAHIFQKLCDIFLENIKCNTVQINSFASVIYLVRSASTTFLVSQTLNSFYVK